MSAIQPSDRPSKQTAGASSAEVVAPPAPPGESPPEAVHRTQAVAAALAELGEEASPADVSQAVKRQTGIDLKSEETAEIMRVLKERTTAPPSLDQPPPEGARRPAGGTASVLR
jgi:hypothetical protein